MSLFAILFDWLIRLATLVVFVDVVLSYFLDRYHPVRRALDQLVEPFLAPIRRLLPASSPIDFSPVVLILGLYLLNQIIQRLFR